MKLHEIAKLQKNNPDKYIVFYKIGSNDAGTDNSLFFRIEDGKLYYSDPYKPTQMDIDNTIQMDHLLDNYVIISHTLEELTNNATVIWSK